MQRPILALLALLGAAIASTAACLVTTQLGGIESGDAGGEPDATSGDVRAGDCPGCLPIDPCAGAIEPRSCCLGRERYGNLSGTDDTCGPRGNESCCTFDHLPAGAFNRANDVARPASMPRFQLGRFLVTTARIKVWINEGMGLQKNAPPVSPAPGSGAHPLLGRTTGWQAAWNPGGASCGGVGCLAKDDAELQKRLRKDPASPGWGCTFDHYPDNPRFPASCVSIYEATAFCAWDGGYLMTEAMWEYAVRGGSEQRVYAWGAQPPKSLDYSVHCLAGGGTFAGSMYCNDPALPVVMEVGHHAAGRSKWGPFDLQGNLFNLTADEEGEVPGRCTNDCVSRPAVSTDRMVARGIAFNYPKALEPQTAYGEMMNARAIMPKKDSWSDTVGFRCAYPNDWRPR